MTSPKHPASVDPSTLQPISAEHQSNSGPGSGSGGFQNPTADTETQAVDGQPSRPEQQQSTPSDSGMPHRTTSESSQPPENDLPPLPARNYEAYQDLAYKNPSVGLDSNRILIRFLFSLSNFVFFGGSLAGLVVFVYQVMWPYDLLCLLFYYVQTRKAIEEKTLTNLLIGGMLDIYDMRVLLQRHFFPRLVIRNTVLLSLKTSAVKSYSLLLERTIELVRSNPILYRAGSKVGTVDSARSDPEMEKGMESELGRNNRSDSSLETGKIDQPVGQVSESNDHPVCEAKPPGDESVEDPESASRDKTSTPAHINQPIYDSLGSLSTTLRRRQNGKSSTEFETQPTRAVKNLADSLERFRLDLYNKHSAYLNAHSISSPNSLYFTKPSRPQAMAMEGQQVSSGQIADEERGRKVIEENKKALGDFKAEIRTLKGMLLNRRNFAGWRTTPVGS